MRTHKYWLAAAALLVMTAASSPRGQTSAEAIKGSMPTGGRASPQGAHKQFCWEHRSECGALPGNHPPLRMSKQVMAKLKSVTRVVNRAVKPRSDGPNDVWSYPDSGYGDCEDYALLKRKVLNQAGIPLSNLLVTVVSHNDGELHAVLTVRTAQGDFVLDNLNNDVKPWRQTGYRFLKRQSSAHAGRWVKITEGSIEGNVASMK
jgi:predicted transglutaminase-like cysteine proteinase